MTAIVKPPNRRRILRTNSLTVKTISPIKPKLAEVKSSNLSPIPKIPSKTSSNFNLIAQSVSSLGLRSFSQSIKRQNTQSFYKSIDSNSLSNLAEAEEMHEIIIKLYSNHGHPSSISCDAFEVIGDDNLSINISKITITPDHFKFKGCSPGELNKLTTNISKMSSDNHWIMDWPPPPPLKHIDIHLFVSTTVSIAALRIWPTHDSFANGSQHEINSKMNPKHISVSLDQQIYYDGDLPDDFIHVIPLTEIDGFGRSIIPTQEPEVSLSMFDNYGQIPFQPLTTIDIKVLSSYISPTEFGLYCIRMFDKDGEYVDVKDLSLISETCCNECTYPPSDLFWGPSEKVEVELRKHLWKAEYPTTPSQTISNDSNKPNIKSVVKRKDPTITVSFQEPTIITAIALMTLRPVLGDNDIAAKKVHILLNQNSVWTGRLRRIINDDNMNKSDSEITTVVFLMDNLGIRKTVLKSLNMFEEGDEEKNPYII